MKLDILVGTRFGRWTVEGEAPAAPTSRGDQVRRLRVRCQCGMVVIVLLPSLRSGRSTSCGCFRRDYQRGKHTRHGRSSSAEYYAWMGMVQRCTNPNNPDFANYGLRGITVCEEWRRDFPAFLEHIGERPGAGYSVDRIENNRGYEPGNVRWATPKEQANNRRLPRRQAAA